jgi:hypothetical protein
VFVGFVKRVWLMSDHSAQLKAINGCPDCSCAGLTHDYTLSSSILRSGGLCDMAGQVCVRHHVMMVYDGATVVCRYL